ncbi:hypothetical protein D3C72_2325080 [compost metagenome]
MHLNLDRRFGRAGPLCRLGHRHPLDLRQKDGLTLGERQLLEQFFEVPSRLALLRGGGKIGLVHVIQGVMQILSPATPTPEVRQLVARDRQDPRADRK